MRHFTPLSADLLFQFSQLEYSIKTSVAQAIRLPDQYFDAIMTQDFALLCTTARAVFATILTEKSLSKMDALINRLRKLNDERVRIVHGLWVVTIEGGKLHHISRNRLKASSHFGEPRGADVAQLADDASQLRWEWERLIWNFGD